MQEKPTDHESVTSNNTLRPPSQANTVEGKTTPIEWKNAGWEGNEPTSITEETLKKGYIRSGNRALDIGCGFGRNANYLASKDVAVVAVNINKEELTTAKKEADAAGVQVEYIKADARNLPLKDQSFDAALDLGCSHLLDREGQLKAEKEAARVLKPGGYLIYFGFNKNHPTAARKPDSPQFRDLDELMEVYGVDFELIECKEVRWATKPEEKADFAEHVGVNVVMRRKK